MGCSPSNKYPVENTCPKKTVKHLINVCDLLADLPEANKGCTMQKNVASNSFLNIIYYVSVSDHFLEKAISLHLELHFCCNTVPISMAEA